MVFKLVVLSCLLALVHSAHIRPRVSNFGARVVGGYDAEVGQFPHQVSLQWGYPPIISYNHFCGGSIISERWVVTAGHCAQAIAGIGNFVVKAGKHKINTMEANEQTVEVESRFVHEDYVGNVAPYDIALLKLKAPLEFNKYVAAIELPEAGAATEGTAVFSGWGSVSLTTLPKYPSILQTVELLTIDLQVCNSSIETFCKPSPLHETNLCTGPLDGGIGACSGDSGGPLIAQNGDHNELVGVASWGIVPCGTTNAPSVFVKVSAFIDWIEETINKYS